MATLILSIRGVPLIDATGVDVIRELIHRQRQGGGDILLTLSIEELNCSLNNPVLGFHTSPCSCTILLLGYHSRMTEGCAPHPTHAIFFYFCVTNQPQTALFSLFNRQTTSLPIWRLSLHRRLRPNMLD